MLSDGSSFWLCACTIQVFILVPVRLQLTLQLRLLMQKASHSILHPPPLHTQHLLRPSRLLTIFGSYGGMQQPCLQTRV